LATLLVLFTRFFSDLGAVAGVGRTFANWGTLLAERSVDTPTQFFLFAALLYEPLVVLLAVVAALRGRASRDGGLGWPLFGAWFVAALLLWSFSSGREPQHAVHVVLPLVLLGGAVLGDLLAALDRRDFSSGTGGALALALLGLLIGLTSAAILLGRVDGSINQRAAALQVAVVATLVVVPLAYVVAILVGRERASGRGRQPAILALLVVALLLGAFTLRSAILLGFYRANDGTELLARATPTDAVRPLVDRLDRLSRDLSVTDGSVRDVTGGNGLSIAADRTVRWPFQWYFREFPNFTVVDAGQAPLADAQVAIAPDETGLAEAGYTPRAYPWLNRVPPAYSAPDSGGILGTLVRPDRWVDGVRFLLYREGIEPAAPETIAVGLNAELAARVFPSSGPFDLADRAGAGSAPGQFDDPIGVAVGGDGTTYVVDQGNARVQRFDADGRFVGIWGGAEGGVEFARTENGLGPTGVAVGPDGLVYVADTWNHRVVVLSSSGTIVRELGGPAGSDGTRAAADVGDDPTAVQDETSAFFGPRAVAVSDDEIYVVDTGNERVQVFSIDGTFRRAWGGYGSGPGELIEPVGIALDAAGRVYVADSGNARVSLFDGDGRPLAQWRVASWPAPDPGGVRPDFQPYLAFDGAGNLYATSAETGEVVVLAPDGRTVETVERADREPLERPVGVAVALGGEILISDLDRDAVSRFEPAAAPPVAVVERAPQPPMSVPDDRSVGVAPTSAPLPRPPGQGN
ncbi:MAG: 6-bladed beta-propeller, partial [Chloroflexota bacterium]|nr:6-bladed beta-propeller [Chloroflexota bacterium]